MPEMLKPTSAIAGYGLLGKIAFITDGRFSGGSHGFIIGHISPEAHLAGNIAIIKDNDFIEIDAKKNTINLLVDEIEIQYHEKDQALENYRVTLNFRQIDTLAIQLNLMGIQ